jgi:uncharacterized protein (TIGR02678 family)
MQPIEVLLSRRWILKSREKELYYQMKDEVGKVRSFLTEKLGYPVIINQNLIKVEKIPASPENWMGIQEFKDKIEYVFLCFILMFLEDKEAGEQFVLSELTEYIQSQENDEAIDWTNYHNRRHLIKVIKFCVKEGLMEINDGNEDNFMQSVGGEVLYENTGASRYFMRNLTRDVKEYQKPEDFLKEEWIGTKEDRGIIRRQRVYRRLLMSMGFYQTPETEEDFAYIKNYRAIIQRDFGKLFDCELHLHRTSAFLIMGEDSSLGKCFPEENTLSDIVLLWCKLYREKIESGEIVIPSDEDVKIPKEIFLSLLEECKHRYGGGWVKKYREMTIGEYCKAVQSYMQRMELIKELYDKIRIYPVAGKIAGVYPKDFKLGGQDE